MADIAELGIKIDSTGIIKAETNLKKLGTTSEQTSKKTKLVTAGVLAIGAAAVGAAASIAGIYLKQSQLIDQNAKLAQTLGTTYTGLSNIQRAADLSGVSMNEVKTASIALTRRLSQAATEAGPAADALNRMGLSAQALQQMPLDQRISKINSAIQKFIPAAEQAAVASQFFGDRNGLILQRLSPETIAQAAKEVEVFGLNLSDVDAAKVEMANDAFSTFKMSADGITKQLTVELAPIIKAVSDLFFQSAEEAGGMGNVVASAVDKAVSAIGFLINAADGAGRVFTIVTSGGAIGFSKITQGIIKTQIALLEFASKVPSVGHLVQSSLDASVLALEIAQQTIDTNITKLNDALNKPLSGELFIQFVEEAKKAGELAAELTVASRSLNQEQSKTLTMALPIEINKEIEKQIKALERAKETWGMSADAIVIYDLTLNKATQQQKDYAQSLLDSVNALESQKSALEEQSAIDRNAESIILEMRTEEQVILDSYARRKEIILNATFETEEARTAILENLEIQRNEKLAEIELARTTQVLEINRQLFSGMASLAGAFAGEQSTLYRGLFAIEQGFAVAKALMNAPTAYTEAYTATVGIPVIGPALAPIAGATAAAAQIAQAAQIKSITPSFEGGGFTGHGSRSGGLDGRGGFMAMLHPQERVIDEYRNQSSGSQVINFNLSAPESRVTQSQIARKMAQVQQREKLRLG